MPGASGPYTSLPPTMVSAPSASLPQPLQLQHLLLQQQSPLAPTQQLQQAAPGSGPPGQPGAGVHTDLFLPLPPAFVLGSEGGAGDQRGAGEGPQASMDVSSQRQQQLQQEAAGETAHAQGQQGHVANGLHPHHGTGGASYGDALGLQSLTVGWPPLKASKAASGHTAQKRRTRRRTGRKDKWPPQSSLVKSLVRCPAAGYSTVRYCVSTVFMRRFLHV